MIRTFHRRDVFRWTQDGEQSRTTEGAENCFFCLSGDDDKQKHASSKDEPKIFEVSVTFGIRNREEDASRKDAKRAKFGEKTGKYFSLRPWRLGAKIFVDRSFGKKVNLCPIVVSRLGKTSSLCVLCASAVRLLTLCAMRFALCRFHFTLNTNHSTLGLLLAAYCQLPTVFLKSVVRCRFALCCLPLITQHCVYCLLHTANCFLSYWFFVTQYY